MRKKVFLLLLALFFLVNVLAYFQASHFIHYSKSGIRTEKPESLGLHEKIWVLFAGVNLPKPSIGPTPLDLGMGYKDLTFPSLDGTKLSAWYVPSQRPKGMALLFHGHAACKSQLLSEAKEFHEQGYELLLVDLRGSGDSEGYQCSFGFWEAKDVEASVRYARDHWKKERIVLFGQSMGSAAILRAFAVHSLPVDAIILGCPFDDFFHTVRNRFTQMGLPSFPLAHLLMFWGSLQLGYDGFHFRPVEDARKVHCPALLLYGEKDRNVLPNESKAIFEGLGGPKTAENFLNCGHESFLLKDPDEWKRAVFSFLNRKI